MAHYLFPEKRELPRGGGARSRADRSSSSSSSRKACMRLHARCTAPWPSGVIHSQRPPPPPPPPRHQSPSTFIMCALARARACARVFNYIFASQLPGERTGREGNAARGRSRRGEGEGGGGRGEGGQKKKRRRRGARAIQPEKSCRGRDEEGESARSNFIAWINRRDRSIDRSIALPRFFYHPSAVSADSRKRIVGR
jgi:hypothetical protein